MIITNNTISETREYEQQWCSRKCLRTGAVQNISMVLFLEREH